MREIGHFSVDYIYVCGGASVYRELLPYCTEALVTKVDAIGSADAFFPNLDEAKGWNLAECSSPTESNGYTIRFCKYINNGAKLWEL